MIFSHKLTSNAAISKMETATFRRSKSGFEVIVSKLQISKFENLSFEFLFLLNGNLKNLRKQKTMAIKNLLG